MLLQHGGGAPHDPCAALLESLCLGSGQPCALVEADGRVVAASPLFARILEREAGLATALASLSERFDRTGRARLETPWFMVDARTLEGTDQVLVQVFGPAVVRARLLDGTGPGLSTRESECVAFALEGHDNAAVAERLGVRPETVKVHLRNAYRKLGTTGRAQLLARMVAWR